MRRYIMAAVSAELIAIICLFVYAENFGAKKQELDKRAWPHHHADLINKSDVWWLLEHRARNIGFWLDIIDNSVPFLFGFPAIAVLSLWIIDRATKAEECLM
jgi:hypothetical protein